MEYPKFHYKMLVDGEKVKGTIESYNSDTAIISLFLKYPANAKLKMLKIKEVKS